MITDLIELRRLHAFITVVEEGHITRAAERLGVKQPSLTRLVQGLEDDLGVLLVHRLPRGVRPTQAGRALLHEARAVLTRAEAVVPAVRRAAQEEQDHLAVGCTSSAVLHPLVSTVLRRFRDTVPQVSVMLQEAGTGELVDALLQGRVDVAFVRSPVDTTSDLVVDPLLQEPMLAALPPGHRFATDDDKPLPLAGLAGEAFVLYHRPTSPGLYNAVLRACHSAGFSPSVTQEAPQLPVTLSLVAAGHGISIVPASTRRLGSKTIRYRGLTGCPELTAPLHLAMRRTTVPPALIRFREIVRQVKVRHTQEA